MAESGRVLHHLKNNIEDKNSTVLIVGFMAEHTLGRRLIEAKDEEDATVRIFGDEYNVHAKIVVLNSFRHMQTRTNFMVTLINLTGKL